MHHPFLVGDKVYLRTLEPTDLEGPYLDWLNDYEITRFLETGSTPTSRESLHQYFDHVAGHPDNVLLAIVDKATDVHIGNIKLGPIHRLHRRADLGILIGAKEFWGRGYAREAVELVLAYGFERLNLHKISLGVYADHSAAVALYEHAGFTVEGTLREHLFRDGAFRDKFVMAIRRSEYGQRVREKTVKTVETLQRGRATGRGSPRGAEMPSP